MIKIITIDREYGSGAAEIASALAERLGWKLWDELLTVEIARIMGCDCPAVEEREERRDALRYRLFKGFIRGSFEGTLQAQRVRFVDADCIREAAERVVRQAARESHCVIVGRGSAHYLRSNPDAFHVFLYAPLQEKIKRLRAMGKSEEEAHVLVGTVDQDRAAYIKQYFKIEWPFREIFDLMINSSLGDRVVVDTILNSVAIIERSLARR
ncbi:MAG TPA: cytidylate kinase-like family protein [Bryobacteraceae bacterium]|nr:cytidylate kinase-like family protein [Bryobacteraceae bacterium]HUO27689.1 cytidylate kinase-like family protein [Bryobacteraceae bacterium]